MTVGAKLLALVMSAVFAGSVWASSSGAGLPDPEKEPMSIREGSTMTNRGRRTRYFIGGGLHTGK